MTAAHEDSRRLLATRGVRALVDGTVATVLPAYLIARGLGPTEVGAVVTATLLGSAVVTLLLGLRGGHIDQVRLLRIVAAVHRDQSGAELRETVRPRSERVLRGEAGRDSPEGRVPLADRGRVFHGQ